MENLVYIHLSSSYEGNERIEIHATSNDVKVFLKANWRNLCKKAWIHLLSIAIAIGTVGIATQAMAEMSQGSTGRDVAELQEKLKKLGYFNRRPTGHFGPLTRGAVIRFQKDQGLTPSGIVEAQTQQALERRIDSSDTDTASGEQSPTPGSDTDTAVAQQSATASNDKAIDPFKLPTLRRGAKASEVKTLQQLLKDAGIYNGQVNGIFDLETSVSVRQFQRSNRLTIDGVVGPRTWAALVQANTQTPDPTFNSSPFTNEPLTNASDQQQGNSKPLNRRQTLQQGDNGPTVRVLQERLLGLGYYRGDTTGNFGPLTKEAVTRFQKDSGLTANGIVDQSTQAALLTPRDIRNFSVAEIQKQLKEKGFYQGPVDGIFNDETKAAIKEAQRAYGVSENDTILKP